MIFHTLYLAVADQTAIIYVLPAVGTMARMYNG